MRTTDPTLPSDEEIAELVPRPGSVVWRRASDARHFFGPGYALLLQVAHPVVGAGVSEHSNFRSDAWNRLFHTLDFLNVVIYGGPERAAAMGRAVRDRHRTIKGKLPDGERYFALDPEAYAWVHATLVKSIFESAARFGRPFDPTEREQFYAQWNRLGRLYGVREQDLPPDWVAFESYFHEMTHDRLEMTDSVRDVLETMGGPPTPPVRGMPRAAWGPIRLSSSHVLRLCTAGMLPPVLRDRFGMTWTRRQELEMRAIARASRAATPVLPRSLRRTGPAYLRWRDDRLNYPGQEGAEPARTLNAA